MLFFSSRSLLLVFFRGVESDGKAVFLSEEWSRQLMTINVAFFTKIPRFMQIDCKSRLIQKVAKNG